VETTGLSESRQVFLGLICAGHNNT